MTTPPTPTSARAGGRLRNGELRRQVVGFLADHAGNEFTPGGVARGLPGGRRSSGAVANALALLADRGEAERSSTRPVRYRATATTTTAAAALPAPSGSPRPITPYDGGTIRHQHHDVCPVRHPRDVHTVRVGGNGGSGGGVRSGDQA